MNVVLLEVVVGFNVEVVIGFCVKVVVGFNIEVVVGFGDEDVIVIEIVADVVFGGADFIIATASLKAEAIADCERHTHKSCGFPINLLKITCFSLPGAHQPLVMFET